MSDFFLLANVNQFRIVHKFQITIVLTSYNPTGSAEEYFQIVDFQQISLTFEEKSRFLSLSFGGNLTLRLSFRKKINRLEEVASKYLNGVGLTSFFLMKITLINSAYFEEIAAFLLVLRIPNFCITLTYHYLIFSD